MNPSVAFLTCAFMGCVVLFVGIVALRRSEQSLTESFRETLFWGTGIFVAMSVQVLALSSF